MQLVRGRVGYERDRMNIDFGTGFAIPETAVNKRQFVNHVRNTYNRLLFWFTPRMKGK